MADGGTSRRVVVTGMGVVTPIGQTVADFWAGMRQGKSGVGPIESFPQNDPHILFVSQIKDFELDVLIAAQIKGFDKQARLRHFKRDKIILHADRYSLFAAAAADEAVKQSGLEVPFNNPQRAASIIGSALGGIMNLEIAYRHIFELKQVASHPLTLVRFIGSSAAAHVGIEYGVKGPTFATCSACSSAAHAIGLGRDYIRNGLVDVAVVGASDAPHTYGMMRAWQEAQLLSPEGIFPFAKKRNGTVLGEGAGILVLESMHHAKARGAKVLAELCGFGMTADGTDMVNPDGVGASEAMRLALEDAQLAPTDIDYVNAHGTAPRPATATRPMRSRRCSASTPTSLRCPRPSPCMAMRWAGAGVSRRSPASRRWKRAGCRRRWGWMSRTPSATSTTLPMSGGTRSSATPCRMRSPSRG